MQLRQQGIDWNTPDNGLPGQDRVVLILIDECVTFGYYSRREPNTPVFHRPKPKWNILNYHDTLFLSDSFYSVDSIDGWLPMSALAGLISPFMDIQEQTTNNTNAWIESKDGMPPISRVRIDVDFSGEYIEQGIPSKEIYDGSRLISKITRWRLSNIKDGDLRARRPAKCGELREFYDVWIRWDEASESWIEIE